MEKHLKFKREWFDILNQCDADLRSDVIEAVFQYFFEGEEPHFTDDARRIAFGFIRAELDAAKNRRKARKPKQEETTGVETAPEPTSAVASAKPSKEEALSMFRLMAEWNNAVTDAEVQPLDMATPLDSPQLIPLLLALRIHGKKEIADLIRNTDPDDFVEFHEFFQNLSD